MQIFESKSYLHTLSKITKKKKNKYYGSLVTDLKKFFEQHRRFEDIIGMRSVLIDSKVTKLLKLRIGNSRNKQGKSSGFRLIVFCHKVKKTVSLLDVYPKTGPDGKISIDENEQAKLIGQYIEEMKNGGLAVSELIK